MRPLVAFDVEVYPNLYFACFIDEDGNRHTVHHTEFLPEELFTQYQVFGWNSNSYDDAILHNWGLPPAEMKQLSDTIVAGIPPMFDRVSFDLYKQIKSDPSVGVGCPGLKEIEFNKGKPPKQTPVHFDDIVPDDMIDACVEYCFADVEETWEIMNDKRHFFDTIFYLHEEYEFKLTKTSAQNIDNLLVHEPVSVDLPRWRGLLADLVSEIERYNTIEIVSAEGGVHGAEPNADHKNCVNLDVESQYPNTMVILGLLGNKTPLFKNMLIERVSIKKSDPIRAGALKIVLNTTYGVLNSDNGWFKMENKEAGTLVCIYSQYSILSLMLRLLKRGAQIIQINTDGVMFRGITQPVIDDIVEKWQYDFNMRLEQDNIDRVIQKDVNNYAAVFADGKVKTKGIDLANSQGRRIYKKNQAVYLSKMVYNILFDRPVGLGIENYDYARFLRPTGAYPIIRIGDKEYTEAVVILPWDESGDEVTKLTGSGKASRFTNLTYCKVFEPQLTVPAAVVLEGVRDAVSKVFGRRKLNGERYANATFWLDNENRKNFLENLLVLA